MGNISYKSTRGLKGNFTASQAIIQGLAKDGGLFVPDRIPDIKEELHLIKNLSYKEMAYFVMSKFFTDFTEEELKECIDKAYGDKFDTTEIAPLKKVDDTYFLELFHGPTLAFKDMALSILPYLMKTAAKKENIKSEIVILTATSGDTGKAALEGFSEVPGVKIIVFFPEEGVSEIQKMQMRTHKGNNTYVVGINGNFDDAQTGVKEVFADKDLEDKLQKSNYMFSSANSINIGRLVPQIVYYFHAYAELFRKGEITWGDKINVTVPTGNFGNILAAYYAKNMGLPIDKLICASNTNKVLFDFLTSGRYDKNRDFVTTISPSMDILISSNLERLLFELSHGDTSKVNELMEDLKAKGNYKLEGDMHKGLLDFIGGYTDEEKTKNSISQVFKNHKYLMDTHTAVAYSVYTENKFNSRKNIIISTASPYKFTASVMRAIDSKYNESDDFKLLKEMGKLLDSSVPAQIKDIETAPIVHNGVCDKHEIKNMVEKILFN
ncbi:MAG: threonine synthase [Clostridiaceae bacterium]|nr:threonine synthase [Clostridiaceae bacterium]